MIHAVPSPAVAPAFPIRTIRWGMAAMIVLLLISTGLTWRIGDNIRHSIDSEVKVVSNAQRLEHYGKVLLMSINAVVSHGDAGAAAEYRRFQPKLRKTLTDLRMQVEADAHLDDAARVDNADLALVAMEYEALDLVGRNEAARAREIIASPRYAYLLNIYDEGIRSIEVRARRYIERSRTELNLYLWMTVLLSAASLLLVVLGWLILIRPARRWGEQLNEARTIAEISARQLKKNQAELEVLNRRLFDQARTDPLTGLQTRLKFNEDMANLWPGVEQPAGDHCALMCDVDFFKQYNDTYGHLAGDEVLQRVSGALRSTLRSNDQLYRFGGEEFLVIFPSCELADAERRAEQLRAAVETLYVVHKGSPIGKVTISIGAACLSVPHIKSPQAWLDEADKALYAAKARGRNTVVAAGELAA